MMLQPLGSEEVEFNAKTDFIKLKYSHFDRSQSLQPIPRARRPPLRAPTNRQAGGEEEFRWLAKDDDDEGRDSDSGISSPKMWGSPSPAAAPSTSDAQRIAGYRQEMMDLVRGAPESAYELSLKDMVDMPKGDRAPVKRKVLERRISSKSESMKSGVFLKMFFPFSLGGDRKSGSSVSGGAAKKAVSISSKVSPKSTVADGEKVDPTRRSSDGNWWSKSRFRGMSSGSGSNGSSYSSSRGSSKSSSISSTGSIDKKGSSYEGGRKEFVSTKRKPTERKPETNKWKMSGCFSFFRTRRSKSKGHDDTIR